MIARRAKYAHTTQRRATTWTTLTPGTLAPSEHALPPAIICPPAQGQLRMFPVRVASRDPHHINNDARAAIHSELSMNMHHSADRDPRIYGSYGTTLHRTLHTTPLSTPSAHPHAPLYATHRHRGSLDERYTPSLATSTPSSSPTTASSSPPPPTSPSTSSLPSSAYPRHVGYSYHAQQYDSRESRSTAVKVRAHSPAIASGHRYAYAPPRAAVFDDEYDDTLRESYFPRFTPFSSFFPLFRPVSLPILHRCRHPALALSMHPPLPTLVSALARRRPSAHTLSGSDPL
ncbi:uncharacterized protein PHACADRAFT_214874 [Phanerochaete carnosa HHB-10118-sp]|uniref:Uncharacterized protein n=1 Tax=Phanerochaete carnosa (strain HHB-10118-sp) TaxID=650164 RepID=K5WDM5_PHACS|nr:uncharacterized protein PHACADRAFT_214874 [Phanerochaete carnosa HHB-10118-sp]EKM48272.1 hypothetical protein PHACADRAFT_214874 [Phanerochaete carnosa HHB-10118-sp]